MLEFARHYGVRYVVLDETTHGDRLVPSWCRQCEQDDSPRAPARARSWPSEDRAARIFALDPAPPPSLDDPRPHLGFVGDAGSLRRGEPVARPPSRRLRRRPRRSRRPVDATSAGARRARRAPGHASPGAAAAPPPRAVWCGHGAVRPGHGPVDRGGARLTGRPTRPPTSTWCCTWPTGNGYPDYDGRYFGEAVNLDTDRRLVTRCSAGRAFDADDATPRERAARRRRPGRPAPDRGAKPHTTRPRAGYPSVYNQMPQHPPVYYLTMQAQLSRPSAGCCPATASPASTSELGLLRLVDVPLVLPLPLLAWATARRMGGSDRAGHRRRPAVRSACPSSPTSVRR